MPDRIYNTATALQALAKQAAMVETIEKQRDTAQDAYEKAEDRLRAAQERFNDLRDQAIEYFPALEAGFSLKRETVGLVDGQIHVVEK